MEWRALHGLRSSITLVHKPITSCVCVCVCVRERERERERESERERERESERERANRVVRSLTLLRALCVRHSGSKCPLHRFIAVLSPAISRHIPLLPFSRLLEAKIYKRVTTDGF